jgi:hypothetical protein
VNQKSVYEWVGKEVYAVTIERCGYAMVKAMRKVYLAGGTGDFTESGEWFD